MGEIIDLNPQPETPEVPEKSCPFVNQAATTRDQITGQPRILFVREACRKEGCMLWVTYDKHTHHILPDGGTNIEILTVGCCAVSRIATKD